MHYALSIIHPVPLPAAAGRFFVSTLGFVEKHVARDVHVVENGALQLRLIQSECGPSNANWPLEIEVISEDLAASTEALLGQDDVWELSQDVPTSESRIEKRLGTAYGVVLVLTRLLDEDELGKLPPLPATLPWRQDADQIVREALRLVPLAFRKDARERATDRAETVTLAVGDDQVSLEHAVRGLIDVTPAVQRNDLVSHLAAVGVCPSLLEPTDRRW